MGLVKGIKNLFGRKQRKERKALKQLDNLRDQLDDPLNDHLWHNNPLAGEQHDPLVPNNPPPPQENPFAAIAREKKRTTGKGKGKSRMKDRHVGEVHGNDGLTQGAHEVQRIDYKREIGDSGTNQGFFKPETEGFHGSWSANDTGVGRVEQMDVDGKFTDVAMEDNLLTARSVASTRLDQRLGLDTIAHEFEAKHGDRRGVVSAKTKGKAAQEMGDVDYSNPETQRSLSNIQVFDYLSNQQDRHDGNIFIDPETGTARGIDNDLSFGHTSIRENDRYHGLPSQIDPQMAERILGLSPEELDQIVGGRNGDYQRLGPREQQGARERLQRLQDHIRQEDEGGKRKNVVDEWNQDTFNKSIQESSGMTSKNDTYGSMGFHAKSLTGRLHYRQMRRNHPELWAADPS